MKKRKGFTLAELLLALATIVVLASALMTLLHYSLVLSAETTFTQIDDYTLRTAALSVTDNMRCGVREFNISSCQTFVDILTYEGLEYRIEIVNGMLVATGDTPTGFVPVEMGSMIITKGASDHTLKFHFETVNGVSRVIENAVSRVRL